MFKDYIEDLCDLAKQVPEVRLGIMGGTFDPIHIGHLLCAEKAREAFGLHRVLFVPAGKPSFKQGQYVTPGADRLAMCKLAIASNPYFALSSMELTREGISYTVDTLRELTSQLPENVALFFITGDDALATIMQWRESGEIAKLADIITVLRPGQEIDPGLTKHIEDKGHFRVHYLPNATIPVSSTELRQWLAQGKSTRYLIPESVRAYIRAHGLYHTQGTEDAE